MTIALITAGKVCAMALNLTSRLQVTAHYFWNRRNAAALFHHGVRLEYDLEQRRSAALILGFTFTLLAVALMFVLSWFKPAGQVGQSSILANRDTGAIYVLVDGRLHPARVEPLRPRAARGGRNDGARDDLRVAVRHQPGH